MSFSPGQLQSALEQAEALPDPAARAVAREIARSLIAFHRLGLQRLVELMRGEGQGGAAVLHRATEDPIVGVLLQLHDLHPGATQAGLVPIERLSARRPGVDRPASDCQPCELCGQSLTEPHPHLLALPTRKLACACDACALLLDGNDTHRYRLVRAKAVPLPGLRLGDAEWSALGVPVGLAFFSRVSASGAVVAGFPGPTGVVETGVDAAAWETLARQNPFLADLEPDVEALLVNRLDHPPAYWRISIDHGYRLGGLVRSRWSGISGGEEVAREVRRFFGALPESPA